MCSAKAKVGRHGDQNEGLQAGHVANSHFRPPPVAGDRRLAGVLKNIAAILERPVIEKILKHLGLEPQPPPKTPTRELVPHHAG
jgi:hypothetical protein